VHLDGVNFAIFSEHATSVVLCLFEGPEGQAERDIQLTTRTGHIWHGFVKGLGAGQVYGYRIDGPWAPTEGHLFNRAKLLIDPYAAALTGSVQWSDAIFGYRRGSHIDPHVQNMEDSSLFVPRSVVVDQGFDWGDDQRPLTHLSETVIYETHVKGMTALHPDVPEELRGTYAGLAQEAVIDHLTSLGVTAVELLPVQAIVDEGFLVEADLSNYWGYNTIGFFAPDPRYASSNGPQKVVDEVKSMIRTMHRHGIEVLLDVVYNHTAEGNGHGPTLSFRGVDNRAYYRLNPANLTEYLNYSGTGNTLNIEHPAVLRVVLDSLRHWVSHFHIDGFRFDLAPALGRENDAFSNRAAFFKALHQDPVLSTVKLIAEPWDVGPGGYQLGHFPDCWSEWNDRFRDSMRSFWLGHPQSVGEFALRMSGSNDLFGAPGRGPLASVNYVTCHDGFTLLDLVSFNEKHNEANLEANGDGHNHNLSTNFGVEGSTDDPHIEERRARARRNLMACTLLSHGVPMILGGDELSRSQRGNNNAYPQDNELTWFDWSAAGRDPDFEEFVRRAISIRAAIPSLRRSEYRRSELPAAGAGDVLAWKEPGGPDVQPHDWGRQSPRALQLHIPANGSGGADLVVLFNAEPHPVEFSLGSDDHDWSILLDTSRPTGEPHSGSGPAPTISVEAESLLVISTGQDSPVPAT